MHYIDGKKVDGIFLGAAGKTEIFLKYNWGGNAGEYYLVRLNGGLVGQEKAGMEKRQFPTLDDRDWNGYVRIL